MVSSKYFIDSAAQRSFDKDGVVLIPSFINMSTVQRMRLAIDRALVHSANYFDRVRIWEDDPDCAWYCLESAAPALAAELLKTSKVNLFFDQVFTKEPGAPATPWHNDQPFWPVRGWPVITIWLALDEITADSGSLEFIAGSHLWNLWFQPFEDGPDGSSKGIYELNPEYQPLPDFDAERGRYRISSWSMNPGDAIAFHALTVHGAHANSHSQKSRRGYAVRYTGKETTYHQGLGVNPQLLNDELSLGDHLDSKQYPVAFDS